MYWCPGCGARHVEPGRDRCRLCPSPVSPDTPEREPTPAKRQGNRSILDKQPAVRRRAAYTGNLGLDKLPLALSGECQCSKCGRACAACVCQRPRPTRWRTEARRRQSEVRAPRGGLVGADRAAVSAAVKRQAQRGGICIDCTQRQAEGESSRCRPCLDKAADSVWRGKIVRAILTAAEFTCQHGREDPCECRACRGCVRAWVKSNEGELRERARLARSKKIRSASAARDMWRARHEAAAAD